MKRKFVITGTVLAIAASLAAGFALLRERPLNAGSGLGSERTQWLTVPADKGDVVRSISASGTLSPTGLVQVGTQSSGTIKRVLVDFNSPVRKGQLIAEIDAVILESDLASALAAVNSANASRSNAAAKLERARRLFEQGFVSRADLDEAITTEASSAASVTQQQSALSKARTNLANARIVSPVDGVVVSREVTVGQTVQASFSTPVLFKIAKDLEQMQIDVNVTEADVGQIREGQVVSFSVDAFPGQRLPGVIEQIRNNYTLQQNVVTYTAIVRAKNPNAQLRPGMTAYVNVDVASRRGVTRIPNSALRFEPPAGTTTPRASIPADDSSRTVWRVTEHGSLEAIEVRVGLSDNQHTELLGDTISAGQALVMGARSIQNPAGPRFF